MIPIDDRPPEKCYYCDNVAEYNELIDEILAVSGVCKKHCKNYYGG